MTLTWGELCPPAGLVLHAGNGMELRSVTDDLLPALASVATAGTRREEWRYRLSAGRWRSLGHPQVDLEGLTDECRGIVRA